MCAQVCTSLCRMQAEAGQAGAEGGQRQLRQVVGRCFTRTELADLGPQQLQGLLQALPINPHSPFGHSLIAELRLQCFAMTQVWL